MTHAKIPEDKLPGYLYAHFQLLKLVFELVSLFIKFLLEFISLILELFRFILCLVLKFIWTILGM